MKSRTSRSYCTQLLKTFSSFYDDVLKSSEQEKFNIGYLYAREQLCIRQKFMRSNRMSATVINSFQALLKRMVNSSLPQDFFTVFFNILFYIMECVSSRLGGVVCIFRSGMGASVYSSEINYNYFCSLQ